MTLEPGLLVNVDNKESRTRLRKASKFNSNRKTRYPTPRGRISAASPQLPLPKHVKRGPRYPLCQPHASPAQTCMHCHCHKKQSTFSMRKKLTFKIIIAPVRDYI